MHAQEIGGGIFRDAGLSTAEPVRGGAYAIADRVGLDVYEQPAASLEVTLARWGGRSRIVLRRDLEPRRANFLVARMIARHRLRDIGVVDSALEAQIAAYLVAPPEPFVRRWHQVDMDLAELAKPFAITRTAAVLRLNEVVGLDVVVVGSRTIHRRTSTLLATLPDNELRALASKRSPKSVRTVPLRDDGGAVALLAG